MFFAAELQLCRQCSGQREVSGSAQSSYFFEGRHGTLSFSFPCFLLVEIWTMQMKTMASRVVEQEDRDWATDALDLPY
jgi:hypothetical protein